MMNDSVITPHRRSFFFLGHRRTHIARLIQLALNIGLFFSLLQVSVTEPGDRAELILAIYGPILTWQLWLLLARPSAQATGLAIEFGAKKSHCLQPIFQGLIAAYWGWYWRDYYARIPEIVTQLLFAYLLELLVLRTRKQLWRLTPSWFPVVISLNFFIWFKPSYFGLQLAVVALAVLCKPFLISIKGDARRHIFNPSAFALALSGVLIMVTGTLDLTRLPDTAVMFHSVPHMLELVVLMAVFVNIWFQIIPITGMAFVGMILMDRLYVLLLGGPIAPYPIDSFVLLGATLLVTDPATSPENQFGKALYGLAYGILVPIFTLLLAVTDLVGPLDKILPVPILNYFAADFNMLGLLVEERLRGFSWSGLASGIAGNRWAQSLIYLSVVFAAMPLLRVTRAVSIAPPRTFSKQISREAYEAYWSIARLCKENSEVCASFNFPAEFRYWREHGASPLKWSKAPN